MNMSDEHGDKARTSGFKSYLRIFNYVDRSSWILYSAAFAAAIAAGAALPLMNLVFGRFVTTFNNFAIGAVSPDDYRAEVSKYS
jgi:ATP-binding cassette subfamily B (MDR/TAP) protein 1